MLSINMDDVIAVLSSCKPYLIGIGICLIAVIIITIIAGKMKKPARGLTRSFSWIAFLLAAVLLINMICVGPMESLLSLVSDMETIKAAMIITDAAAVMLAMLLAALSLRKYRKEKI